MTIATVPEPTSPERGQSPASSEPGRRAAMSSGAGLVTRLARTRGFVLGASMFTVLVVLCLLVPLISDQGPLEIQPSNRLQPPGDGHPFGTDTFGRDLLSRVAVGGQISLLVGLSITCTASILGVVIGLYSTVNRFLDAVLMRLSDGLMSFPTILLAIAIMAALGYSTVNVVIALTVVFTPMIARVVRAAALSAREETYVDALRTQGAGQSRILWLNVFPNVVGPLIVQATAVFVEAIVVEAGLSFVGAGVPAPSPSWGNILFDGKSVLATAWWMVVFPGAALSICVLAMSLMGDGLRDTLDPNRRTLSRRTLREFTRRVAGGAKA